MFSIIRLIGGGIFFGCSITIIKKVKISHKRILYIVFALVTLLFITVSAMFPIENFLITFDSPQKAYEYKFGKSNIELVIEGDNCDFVVDSRNRTYTYSILPKTEKGWKIGNGINIKKIATTYSEEISITVYQYKNTNDYFINILDTNGGEVIIIDDYNTKFYSLENENDSANKTIVNYYAHIVDFDQEYSVTVNGKEIVFKNKIGD